MSKDGVKRWLDNDQPCSKSKGWDLMTWAKWIEEFDELMPKNKYLLENKRVIPCKNLDWVAWAKWFATCDSKVNKTIIGESVVSTIFLGVDHSDGCGPPILFESMVFGGELDQEIERCSTWEQAEEMHDSMCKRVANTIL